MINLIKTKQASLWVLLGPLFFLSINGLLLTKTSFHLGSVLWIIGLAISTVISCGISYLVFQEMDAMHGTSASTELQKDKALADLRSILDETHRLYRGKVSKLEGIALEIEKEQTDKLKVKEIALSQLQDEYDTLLDQSAIAKNQAHSFQVALEDALEQVGELSQKQYLTELQQIPNDLLKRHQQLRDQFEEKSVVLDETRRRLFATEGFLLALKKERGLELLDQNKEQEILIQTISELLGENKELEKEIDALERLITASFKPASSKKTAKKLEEMLEFQFDTASSIPPSNKL